MERGRLSRKAVPPRQEQRGLDAELYSLYQASKILEERSKQGQDYTILSDSTVAISRELSDSTGPGQRFAIAIAEVCNRLASRVNTLTLRWAPSHSDIEGNEVADDWAKMATTCATNSTSCRPTSAGGAVMT